MAEPKLQLNDALKGVKTKWGDQIKLSKAEKGAPAFPLPVAAARKVETPPNAAQFDVEDLTFRLWLDSLEVSSPPPVRAEVLGAIPEALRDRMGAHVTEHWLSLAWGTDAGASRGWHFEEMLTWVEANFVKFMWLVPACLEAYDGTDENDMTIRRYAIVEPPKSGGEEEESSEEEESEESEEESEETRKKRDAAEARGIAQHRMPQQA